MKPEEIKFRGKRIDNGEWVYGFYLHSTMYDTHYITASNPLTGKGQKDYKVDPATVGMLTGVPDKNGAEIYWGDTVTGHYCIGARDKQPVSGAVFYQDGFHLVGEDLVPLHEIQLHSLEVTGNIHDNPELAPVKEDA